MSHLTRRSLPLATVPLARFLVGKRLVYQSGRRLVSGRIVETEAYPPGDPTGYFRNGLTTANAPLFGPRGTAYVRMMYGTCFNLNLAAEAEGTGAGVLIRAVEPLDGIALMRANRPGVRDRDLARGPGRLCSAFGIGRALSGIDLTAGHTLWFEAMRGRPAAVVVSTRIGLSRDQHRRLRFLERGSAYVSVPP